MQASGSPVTSETVGGASVAVHHAPGVAGSTASHAPAVVEGLPLPVEPCSLLRALRLATGLVLRMEGTDFWKPQGTR